MAELNSHEIFLQATMKTLGINKKSHKPGGEYEPKSFTPTGIIEVDQILGEGQGVPDGTLIEICGESGSGKSTVSYYLAAEYQKKNKRVALLNIENSFYPPRAKDIGVQINNPDLWDLFENIETAEQYGELLLALVRSRAYGLIIVDSITAMVPESEINKELNETPVFGAHARLINRLCKKLCPACDDTQTTVVLINQFRTGAGNRPNEYVQKSTGGAAMEYFTHMRLWISRIYSKTEGPVLGDNGEIIGGKSVLEVMKTRYGQPHITTRFPIMFQKSDVNPVKEFIFRASAKYNEYIEFKRKVYSFIDKSTGEVLAKTKDENEFIQLLSTCPAPSVLTKGDKSKTGLEYVCSRLKISPEQRQAILEKSLQPPSIQETLLSEDEENTEE